MTTALIFLSLATALAAAAIARVGGSPQRAGVPRIGSGHRQRMALLTIDRGFTQ